jgi:hypothetical protein
MHIDYPFHEKARALRATTVLIDNQIFAILTCNVRLLGSAVMIHRIEVNDDDADQAVSVLTERGLMGKASK